MWSGGIGLVVQNLGIFFLVIFRSSSVELFISGLILLRGLEEWRMKNLGVALGRCQGFWTF